MKTAAQAMEYEFTSNKKINGKSITATAKKNAIKTAESLSTLILFWILVKRHKVVLLAIGNIVLLLNTVFPEWTQFVKSVL